jgi:ESCRT-I complex subunit VPS28
MSLPLPFSLDEEVRLYTNNTDREKSNLLATLFGIVVALDYLERAYIRDSITAAECVVISTKFEPNFSC